MTPKERLLTVLSGGIPDRVPVCPDISNMIPAKLTGKPFQSVYLYKDPPLWKAYIDAVKKLGIDGGFELYDFGNLFGDLPECETRIVKHGENETVITQDYYPQTGLWDRYIKVHTSDNPPAHFVKPETIGLAPIPESSHPVESKQWPQGMELWRVIREELGEHGIIGMPSGFRTCVIQTQDDVYDYYENPAKYHKMIEYYVQLASSRISKINKLEIKPDFLFCGASGSLVLQTPKVFRELILPGLKEVTKLAARSGIPTHVHSCGPEMELVKMAAKETELTIIDPLEIPPMGDCDLAKIKKDYGKKLVLKGNLHTTNVMLHGSPSAVQDAARQAIDDAAGGGRFILSTGDQCGRDTPLLNIQILIETAEKYGKY